MALPSLGRFNAKAAFCRRKFDKFCVGPAASTQRQRLEHAQDRERERFVREYNDKLYTGLVGVSLVCALLSRFALRQVVLEILFWGSFLFLEVRVLAILVVSGCALEGIQGRERQWFVREYNDKLYTGLVGVSLVCALLSRFALRQVVLEILFWGAFLFLEVRLLGLFPCSYLQSTAAEDYLLRPNGVPLLVHATRPPCAVADISRCTHVQKAWLTLSSMAVHETAW